MDFSLSSIQTSLRETLTTFARKELNEQVSEDDASSRFPWEKWKKCAQMGVMGLPIPESHGGQGADMLTSALALEALGYACKDSGLVHAIITHILSALQILTFGTDEQKRVHLSRAASGEIVLAQAITEPDSGSDALDMKTRAEKGADAYKINGTKLFISNGPIADIALVFAVTDAAKKKFGAISCFIVEKDDPGFTRCGPMPKLGLRTLQNGELVFRDCAVPASRLLGREGNGMAIFSEGMRVERTLLFACHLGIMKRTLDSCIKYASERQQGGQPIIKHQFLSDKIARMLVNLELGKLILYKSAWLIDQKMRSTLEASIAKLFISESLKSACLDAVQIHGAYGYMKEFDVERDMRDSIAATIYSGTSEIQKIILATLASA
jgi:alkylation response protein AidB-like acyl-CoA dehydrogenase